MIRKGSMRIRRNGCGLLFGACVVTCLLVLANRVLVSSLYAAVVPARFDYDRLRTMVQFLFMVGLLLPEWWFLDRLAQLLRAASRGLDSSGNDDQLP